MQVAIVGAGMAGLSCARFLHEHGCQVVILDKARRPSGRMASWNTEELHFDRGAQYFTARDPDFQERVGAWRLAGVVDVWDAPLVDLRRGRSRPRSDRQSRFVGVPSMGELAGFLAASGPARRQGFEVESLTREANGWFLYDKRGSCLGCFDYVLLAVPAPQAAAILPSNDALAQRVATVTMAPCLALGVRFASPLNFSFGGAFVQDSALSWIASERSKPGRPDLETWVLHASAEWSEQHFDDREDNTRRQLLEAFQETLGLRVEAPVASRLHRWRYAKTTEPLRTPSLFDAESGLGLCGDWSLGARVEDAFLSGQHLARQLLASGSLHSPDSGEGHPYPLGS